MATRRLKAFAVSAETIFLAVQGRLKVALEGLPPDADYRYTIHDLYSDSFLFVYSSAEFPEVPPEERIPIAPGIYESHPVLQYEDAPTVKFTA